MQALGRACHSAATSALSYRGRRPAGRHMATTTDVALTSSPSTGASFQQVIRSEFLQANNSSPQSQPTHLIVLNWTLPRCLLHLWPTAVVRVCADGGANRLHDEVPAMLPDEPAEAVRRRFIPDVIHGDCDSLRPDVRDFYTSHGVRILESNDQDTTDLTKCVMYLEERYKSTLYALPVEDVPGAVQGAGSSVAAVGSTRATDQGIILALGALGGRLDHTLSNLNTLHMFRHLSLALMGEGNLVRLVRAGTCLILPERSREGPTCGLVPLAGAATVTLKGLKWGLDNDVMQFGGLVSTSNAIDSDQVTVETSQDLIWTTQLQELTA